MKLTKLKDKLIHSLGGYTKQEYNIKKVLDNSRKLCYNEYGQGYKLYKAVAECNTLYTYMPKEMIKDEIKRKLMEQFFDEITKRDLVQFFDNCHGCVKGELRVMLSMKKEDNYDRSF